MYTPHTYIYIYIYICRALCDKWANTWIIYTYIYFLIYIHIYTWKLEKNYILGERCIINYGVKIFIIIVFITMFFRHFELNGFNYKQKHSGTGNERNCYNRSRIIRDLPQTVGKYIALKILQDTYVYYSKLLQYIS